MGTEQTEFDLPLLALVFWVLKEEEPKEKDGGGGLDMGNNKEKSKGNDQTQRREEERKREGRGFVPCLLAVKCFPFGFDFCP